MNRLVRELELEPVLDCDCECVCVYTVCSVYVTSLRMSDAMFFKPLNMPGCVCPSATAAVLSEQRRKRRKKDREKRR